MNSFSQGFLARQLPTHDLVRSIARVAECKGREELFARQSPQVLETLRRSAVISSTESSNRIEGVTAARPRIEDLVERRDTPRTRSEQEIAGYREVLELVHSHHADMDLTPNLVLQLHRDLFQYTARRGGRWKTAENLITESGADGTPRVRFRPTSPLETPEAMEALHRRFARAWEEARLDRTLLVGAYVLDFLCIHPFLDGNGRMARLLTLLLLYQSGFRVGRFVSLERVVERSRDGYYDSLGASSRGWHDGEHTLLPWWEYFLGVLTAAYREFEERVGDTGAPRGAKREMVIRAIERLPRRFRYAEVAAECPGVSRPTITRAMGELRQAGEIRCVGAGRGAYWEKTTP